MSTSFVILAHTGLGPDHYDLMIEQAGALATWQLTRLPQELSEGQSTPARRLASHRTAYLEYEGPVSGGRGNVARVDQGRAELTIEDDGAMVVLLEGRHVRGRYEPRPADTAHERCDLRRLRDF